MPRRDSLPSIGDATPATRESRAFRGFRLLAKCQWPTARSWAALEPDRRSSQGVSTSGRREQEQRVRRYAADAT